jgi:ZIP family zinc transporter
MDAMMGFAGGVMVAAACWSLLVPAIDMGGVPPAAVGMIAGAGFLFLADQLVPHLHSEFPNEATVEGPRVVWQRSTLLMLAITLHNLPEGLAVGVGFGDRNVMAGASLAIGIGLQNIPEGLAVAIALISIGYGRGKAFAVASLTGLAEPVAGLLGAYAVAVSQLMLPWAMSFAAGAMIYVISHEIIPETHRNGSQTPATLGLMIGLAAMMMLDISLS